MLTACRVQPAASAMDVWSPKRRSRICRGVIWISFFVSAHRPCKVPAGYASKRDALGNDGNHVDLHVCTGLVPRLPGQHPAERGRILAARKNSEEPVEVVDGVSLQRVRFLQATLRWLLRRVSVLPEQMGPIRTGCHRPHPDRPASASVAPPSV